MAVVVTIAKGYDLSYIWKTQDHAAGRTIGGYYIDAAQAGELAGPLVGRSPGPRPHPRPGRPPPALRRGLPADRPAHRRRLGRPRSRYPTFADHLARLTAAEPHATAERLIELERQAAQATGQPAAYYDVTVSFSKSISVLHASLRENERRARLDGDQQAAAYWAGREETFQEVLHRANRAALEYLQAWAGITRTGYHGTRIDGRESGRFERAGLIVTCWLAEATITRVMCGTIRPRGTDRDAGVAVEGCQKKHERARNEGGRVSAWKMESGWPGAAPEHAPASTAAARRGYPGRVCGAPAVSTVRSITGPRHTFLASGGLTVVRARWDVGCGTAGHPALQGRPELPTVRGTT